MIYDYFFFFKQKTAYELRISDWSSDVCSSDLPDLVLLTGGTDGGNPEPICSAAQVIAVSAWGGPVVVAGNVEAQDRVARILAGQPHVLADNVVPQIGVLDPASARSAVREMFLAQGRKRTRLTSRH